MQVLYKTFWYCLFRPAVMDDHWLKWQKQELGSFAGVIVMLGALGVMVIILAVLALVVVKALTMEDAGSSFLQRMMQELAEVWKKEHMVFTKSYSR